MKITRIKLLLLFLCAAADSSIAQDADLKAFRLELGAQRAAPGGYVSLTDAFAYTGLEGYYYSDRIDFVYLHGKTTGANLLVPAHDAGFRAFSSALLERLEAWKHRNSGLLIKLDPDKAKAAFNTIKTSRDLERLFKKTKGTISKISGYEQEHSGPGERLIKLEPGDVILYQSLHSNRKALIYIERIDDPGTRARMTVLLKYKR